MIETPDGTTVAGPYVRWIGRRHGRRQDRLWANAWSPERIASRIRVDSLMMSRCGSHMRLSTRPCMFRAAGRCAVNWRRVCGPGERCEWDPGAGQEVRES